MAQVLSPDMLYYASDWPHWESEFPENILSRREDLSPSPPGAEQTRQQVAVFVIPASGLFFGSGLTILITLSAVLLLQLYWTVKSSRKGILYGQSVKEKTLNVDGSTVSVSIVP